MNMRCLILGEARRILGLLDQPLGVILDLAVVTVDVAVILALEARHVLAPGPEGAGVGPGPGGTGVAQGAEGRGGDRGDQGPGPGSPEVGQGSMGRWMRPIGHSHLKQPKPSQPSLVPLLFPWTDLLRPAMHSLPECSCALCTATTSSLTPVLPAAAFLA